MRGNHDEFEREHEIYQHYKSQEQVENDSKLVSAAQSSVSYNHPFSIQKEASH